MKTRRTYDIGHGEPLTIPEIAAKTGISTNTLHQRWRRGQRGEALIAPVDRHEASRTAVRASRQSRKQPKFIVEPDMSHEEIAAELGLGRRYVAKLERNAIRKIRERLGI